MRRPLEPYIRIIEDLIEARISIAEFRTRTIQQYDREDAGVRWDEEWGVQVERALDQMDGDAEVVCPEAPEESYISDVELLRSCRENLRILRDALRRAGDGTA